MAALPFAACTMTDTPSEPDPTVQSHFFPLSNGLIYTYSRFDGVRNQNDTLRCRLRIGGTRLDPDFFLNMKTGDTLYYIGFMNDANGNQAAVLRNGDTTLLALDGRLVQGATWVADEVHGIHATVLDHYDDYYLPGRTVHYPDVLVVKYIQLDNPNTFTLRFFARDRGLIREVNLYDNNTEISSLQLLAIDSPH